MTPTPITDAAILTNPDVLRHFAIKVVPAVVAAAMERQLIAALAKAARLEAICDSVTRQIEGILSTLPE